MRYCTMAQGLSWPASVSSSSRGPSGPICCPRSPPAAAEEDDGDGLEHDAEVLAQALAADVLQVVAHLGAHVFQRAVVVVVDLGQPRDPRLGPLAERVLGDVARGARQRWWAARAGAPRCSSPP